jgi:hypothetical protein
MRRVGLLVTLVLTGPDAFTLTKLVPVKIPVYREMDLSGASSAGGMARVAV